MPKIGEAITVLSPVEKVFEYLSDPDNLPELWPSLVKVKDVQPLPEGGYRARYEYKMAGGLFKGKGEYSEIVPNKSFVIKTTGGITSTMTWVFRTRDHRTRLTLTVDYKIPIPLLGKIAEVIILKMNEQEIALMMSNIRARFLIA